MAETDGGPASNDAAQAATDSAAGTAGDSALDRTDGTNDAALDAGLRVPEADPYAALFAPDRVLEIAIELDAADWDALRAQARSIVDIFGGDACQSAPFPRPFTYYPASVTVDGARVELAGVRKKGFFGSLSYDKPSLKVDFSEFVADQTLEGVPRLTLNNAKQDASYLNQCLGYALFRDAGVPAPRCGFATVAVNGEDLGLYVHVEPIKKPFLRRHFDDDEGNLYEGTLSDFRQGWMGTFERKTNEQSDPSQADIQAIADALASGAAPLSTLDPLIDLERFYAFWAVESLVAHIDGYTGNQNNFYLYGDPNSGRFVFIPWGADQLFNNGESPGGDTAPAVLSRGAIAAALYNDPQGRARYVETVRRLLSEIWHTDERLDEIERERTLIEPHIAPSERAAFVEGVEQVARFVGTRRVEVEQQLDDLPAQAAAPRDSLCFETLGTLHGSFDTAWNSLDNESVDPRDFSGELVPTLGGFDYDPQPGGFAVSVAGIDPEADSPDFEAAVALVIEQADGTTILAVLSTTVERVAPGELALDHRIARGVLVRQREGEEGQLVGILAEGTLTFDEAATRDGAPVRGRFEATVYSAGLLAGR